MTEQRPTYTAGRGPASIDAALQAARRQARDLRQCAEALAVGVQ